jgi:hypothetical protein
MSIIIHHIAIYVNNFFQNI